MTDNTLGPLTADEIKMVKEHRELKLKQQGWHQGANAMLSAFDIEASKVDGTVPVETVLSTIRWALRNTRDSYNVR